MKRLAKEDIYKLGVVLLIFLIISSIVLVIISKNKPEEEDEFEIPETNQFEIVSNYNIFFFVNNNVNIYINYTTNNNNTAAINFLDKEYSRENNITEYNIQNLVPFYNQEDFYKATLTKSYSINDNVIVYYTEGKIVNEGFEETTIIQNNARYLLYVDYENMAASIEIINTPLDEENFIKEVDKNKEISLNNYNKIEQIELMNYMKICSIYISDFIEKVYTNKGEAFHLTTNFASIQDFNNYIEKNNLTSNIHSCEQSMNEEGKRVYEIIDTNNYKYTFTEETILNYKVSVNK